jgi:hypothetical protein
VIDEPQEKTQRQLKGRTPGDDAEDTLTTYHTTFFSAMAKALAHSATSNVLQPKLEKNFHRKSKHRYL